MEQEKEKKKMSKGKKKILIVSSSFIAVIIIVGIVLGIVLPKLNKKEIETSVQLENENIQEESKIIISDEELKEMVKAKWHSYTRGTNETIDEIEQYEDDGKGKYIYLLLQNLNNGYSPEICVCFIDASNINEKPIIRKFFGCSPGSTEELIELIEKSKKELKWDETRKQNTNGQINISESELQKYIEQKFYEENTDTDIIDKIEKYEEDGNGKYIYVIYSHYFSRITNTTEEDVNVYLINATYEELEIEETVSTSERYLDKTVQECKENFNYNTHRSSSSSSNTSNTKTYLDDTTLKALAFKKWLEKDEYINMQYQYNNCVYTGIVTRNSDGSVSVDLTLYDKANYQDNMKYTGNASGAGYYGKTTIKLTKEEATK